MTPKLLRLFALSASVFATVFSLPQRDAFQSRAHDPEETMTVPEIITYWGYPSEVVPVTTEDGYILDVHRIPYGKYDGPSDKQRPVAFLQHGLEAASSNWVANLPNEALGFMMADAGFDVWMGNMRGNTYGKQHTSLDPNGHTFWKFSWDEMAKYDLEAMIDTALRTTNQSQLYYVGHSQGTLTMFSKLSTDQAFGSKIRKYFALAPVGTVGHINGLLYYMAEYLSTEIEFLLDLFGEDQFLPSGTFIDAVSRFFCGIFHHGNPVCGNILFLIAGPNSHQLNETRIPVYLGHCPAGTSTQNVIHWSQMVKSNKQQMYDYESADKNIEHYGQRTPPLYDISLVNVPTYLYWSSTDWLADEKDVTQHILANYNPEYLVENNHLNDFNHLDFIWGLRAATEIYEPIINIIHDDLQNSSN